MDITAVRAWCCAVCGDEWLKTGKPPIRCALHRCRSRKWNRDAGLPDTVTGIAARGTVRLRHHAVMPVPALSEVRCEDRWPFRHTYPLSRCLESLRAPLANSKAQLLLIIIIIANRLLAHRLLAPWVR